MVFSELIITNPDRYNNCLTEHNMKSVTRVSLTEFLSQTNIETSPAWELINGEAVQKTNANFVSFSVAT